MVQILSTVALMAATASASALLPRQYSPQCPQANGTIYGQYTILCGYDYYGSDLAFVGTPSFGSCIQTCSNTPHCVDVSYVSGGCYLKSALNQRTVNPNVNTAALTSVLVGNYVAAAITPHCPEYNNTLVPTQHGVFAIRCGKDYYGGDLEVVQSDNLYDCIQTCSNTANCVDVSYDGNNCYLKSSISSADSNPNVQTGVSLAAEYGFYNPLAKTS
ncbi:hypothetical protein MBLNU457_1189t1 [Dothideomycetes sp. NU457]